jgi:glycosyltransferase involved in cell wall biosynthesis
MRIAYMLTSLGIGGAEKQVIAIGERMAARGHHVSLIVLKSPAEQEWPTTLPVYRLGVTKSVPGVIGGLARARRLFHLLKPDLLHSHTFPANMMARMLRALGAAPRVLSTIHNVYEGRWHRTLAYRITDPLSIMTTAVCQAVADRYIQIRAVPRRKLCVITNGIDTDTFSPSHYCATGAATAPASSRPFLWLAAGRDVPAKDFDCLLAAFQIVHRTVPDAELHIAGRPAAHRSQNDGSGIRWLGLCDDLPKTLATCDAFVLSSAWEGLPLVIAEAMAMEKPVVATNVGGVRELVSGLGLLVPPKNSQALADAMLSIMRMPELDRRAIGRAARQHILSDFEINRKVEQWESLYAGILDLVQPSLAFSRREAQ